MSDDPENLNKKLQQEKSKPTLLGTWQGYLDSPEHKAWLEKMPKVLFQPNPLYEAAMKIQPPNQQPSNSAPTLASVPGGKYMYHTITLTMKPEKPPMMTPSKMYETYMKLIDYKPWPNYTLKEIDHAALDSVSSSPLVEDFAPEFQEFPDLPLLPDLPQDGVSDSEDDA